MFFGVKIALEPAGDIVAGREARRRHRLGRSARPRAGTAQEIQGLAGLDALGAQFFSKTRVHTHIGIHLPGNENRALAELAELRHAPKATLRLGTDVAQLSM